MITRILSLRNRYFFFSDAILLAFVPVLALALRLDGFARLLEFSVPLLAYTFLSLALKLAVFIPLGLYQRFWRYASIEELILILKAIFFAGLLNI
ncbi:MAG: polysaccharide biosynthesis protein, partial [Chloroflexi bacterium]|nr:polysaccharide biosynthesis protein [Chloroflexota bacterium]